MRKFIGRVLLGSLLGVTLVAASAPTVDAQGKTVEYWPGYWRWYDHTYRPYYHRYYGPTVYQTAPAPYYNPNYNTAPYGSGYYTPYYTTPVTPYTPNGVQVGPLRFGWW